MNLIEHESHFWELYQDQSQFYLAIAVDVSSVVSCWDLVLTETEIQNYENMGRDHIDQLAKKLLADVYRGDFSYLNCHLAPAEATEAMQLAFKTWRLQQSA